MLGSAECFRLVLGLHCSRLLCTRCCLFPVWLNMFLPQQTDLVCISVCFLFFLPATTQCITAEPVCKFQEWFAYISDSAVMAGWQAAGAGRPDVTTVYLLLFWEAYLRLSAKMSLIYTRLLCLFFICSYVWFMCSWLVSQEGRLLELQWIICWILEWLIIKYISVLSLYTVCVHIAWFILPNSQKCSISYYMIQEVDLAFFSLGKMTTDWVSEYLLINFSSVNY